MCGSVNVKPIRVALVVAALALIPSDGFGWGRDGHQVTARARPRRMQLADRRGPEGLSPFLPCGTFSTASSAPAGAVQSSQAQAIAVGTICIVRLSQP